MSAESNTHCERCGTVGSTFLEADKLSPEGTELVVGGLPTYAAGARDGRIAILIATDVFGWALPNVRDRAQRFAAAAGPDVTVYVPDLLAGDAMAPASFSMAAFPAWLGRHSDAVVVPLFSAVVSDLRASRGAHTIIAVGFCWGARYAMLGATGAPPAVDAFAVAHPSRTTPEEYGATATPGLFLLAETDAMFMPPAVEAVRALGAAGHDFAFAGPYVGTNHGFAARGDDADPLQHAAREDVIAQIGAFTKRVAGGRK
jgi:dienelactone hydrolase